MTDPVAEGRSANKLTLWHLLLLLPYVGVLWVPFYNSVEPTIYGFPFFYIYQIAWVLLSSALIAIVYLLTERA